jgi:hypothetical protein
MLVAVIALVSSLTGGAVAAKLITGDDIAKKAIAKKHLKKNAVVSKKVKDRSLKAKDFKAGQLPAGETGPVGAQGAQGSPGESCLPSNPACVGPQGPKGDPGEPATSLFAKITHTGGLHYGSGATDALRLSTGEYAVEFEDHDLTNCVAALTIGFGHPHSTGDGLDTRAYGNVDVNADYVEVDIRAYDPSTETFIFKDSSFHLAVFC